METGLFRKKRYVSGSMAFIDYAIANAERLDKLNERKTPASAVPGTKVH